MDDDDEQPRQFYEKRILIAIIAGPMLIWFFRSGFYLTAFDLLVVATHAACRYTVAVLAEMFFALALLSAWRHPLIPRPAWPTILVILLAVIFGTIGRAIVMWIFVYPDFYWPFFYNYELLSQCLLLALCLPIFVLIRRFTGACLIEEEVSTLPPRSPLSIAELMYWTGLVAVACMTVPYLRDFKDSFGMVVPNQTAVWSLLLSLAACVAPTLVLTMVSGSFWVRMSLATGCLTVVAFSQRLLLIWTIGMPFQFPGLSLATEVLFHVVGAAMAVGWVFLRGDRYIRLKRRSDA